MPRTRNRKKNLSQAQAIIIAAIITSVLGGLFLLESTNRPVVLQFDLTPTSRILETSTKLMVGADVDSTSQAQTEAPDKAGAGARAYETSNITALATETDAIPIVISQAETEVLMVADEPTLAEAPSSWRSLVDFHSDWQYGSCGAQLVYFVLPNYISPVENSEKSYKAITKLTNLPAAPIPDIEQLQWGFRITNMSSNTTDFFTIDKIVRVRIEVLSTDVDEHLNLWNSYGAGCGGAADKNLYPNVKLNQDPKSRIQVLTSDFYDFFTFQPGEQDIFGLNFICETPGSYRPSVEMKVTYKGQTKKVIFEGKDIIVCPKSFSVWLTSIDYYYEVMFATQESSPITESPLERGGDYYWNGKEYTRR